MKTISKIIQGFKANNKFNALTIFGLVIGVIFLIGLVGWLVGAAFILGLNLLGFEIQYTTETIIGALIVILSLKSIGPKYTKNNPKI